MSVLSSEAQDQLTVNGLGGDDFISAAALSATVNLAVFDGGAGNDTIIGNASANTIIAGSGNNYLIGLGGNDTLISGSAWIRFKVGRKTTDTRFSRWIPPWSSLRAKAPTKSRPF